MIKDRPMVSVAVRPMTLACVLTMISHTAVAHQNQDTPAWINAQGEVTDAYNSEPGYGKKIEGLDRIVGEITGKPAPGSKFVDLQIGMLLADAKALLGPPTDEGNYVPAHRAIPLLGGGGGVRTELIYRGQGRLIFDQSPKLFSTKMHLVWIIHSASESGESPAR